MVSKSKLGSQWVIDPKCFEPRDFKSEYIRRIGDTGVCPRPRTRRPDAQRFTSAGGVLSRLLSHAHLARSLSLSPTHPTAHHLPPSPSASGRAWSAAPNFVFQKVMPPDKNKSTGYLDGATLFPPREQFTSEYREKLVADKTAGMPGYQKSVPFKVKEVQIQFSKDKQMQVIAPSSHEMYQEPDMRAANVRNLRSDGLRAAGLPSTTLPYYNIAPGVGGEDPNQGRCVFDAFQDSTNKFRDTRRFAQMNNPRIPRGHAYNPLTGDVHRALKAPGVEMAPRDPLRPPPLSSLAQLRPPSSRVEQSASKSAFESTRPW